MESTLGYLAQIVSLCVVVFFGLHTASGLVNLYLRFHDRLSIERRDVLHPARNLISLLKWLAAAALFFYIPFFMALGFFLCAILIAQILKVNVLIKEMERN